jgi:crystallin, alpha B
VNTSNKKRKKLNFFIKQIKISEIKKMAMLPILLDMVDEIYDNLDKPKNFADIPMLFVPQRGPQNCQRMQRHPRMHRRGWCSQRCPRSMSNKENCPCKPANDDFKVALNVKSFKPEEISVKVKGREIIVEGTHEEREDEFGFVSRQFTRRYVVPEEFDLDTVATFLDSEGKMIIKAEKPKSAVESNERVIPIERVATIEADEEKKDEKPVEADSQKKKDDGAEAKLE